MAGRGAVSARVLPAWWRKGVGTAILRELARRAAGMGFTVVGVNTEDSGSVGFAERFGFREVDRQVEQVREIGDEPWPRVPDGIEIVRVSERPELWRAVYDTVGAQAFQDMALTAPLVISLEQWEREFRGPGRRRGDRLRRAAA
jgi:mycothiol synthase